MAKIYTVGVIGAGRIGKIHIKNIIRNIPGLKLKRVAERVPPTTTIMPGRLTKSNSEPP